MTKGKAVQLEHVGMAGGAKTRWSPNGEQRPDPKGPGDGEGNLHYSKSRGKPVESLGGECQDVISI